MNNNITTEDFKLAVKQNNIDKWSPTNCSMCGSPLYFVFEDDGEIVLFDDNCKCSNSELQESSYEEILACYNDLNEEEKIDMLNQFGILNRFTLSARTSSSFDNSSIMNKIMQDFKDMYTDEYMSNLERLSYEDDRDYPENFSNWWSCIIDFGKFKHANVVANQIFNLNEVKIMRKTDNIENLNLAEINLVLKPTLDKMKDGKIYSIKNGCFSDKFNFDISLAQKNNLAEKLWKLNYDSSLFETGGYTELVVRELIPNTISGDIPTIYNGMPLREEVRVFYNIDTSKLEYMVDYWDYDYCAEYLSNKSDRIVFDWFHNKIGDREINHSKKLKELFNRIEKDIPYLLFNKEKLHGIWSIDFLWDSSSDDIYLIDMARGYRSAYYSEKRLKNQGGNTYDG